MIDPPPPNPPQEAAAFPMVSVVVPVFNESDSVAPLIDEIAAAMADQVAEIVFVDDGSDDATPARLSEKQSAMPQLRVIRHRTRAGQSAAIAQGIRAARAPVIATLDGDGQNDPADIPRLLDAFSAAVDRDRLMVVGHRVRRRDTWVKRVSSRIANAIRQGLLGDATPDTGCGLKVFARSAFLKMPHFDHMHRFLPALMLRQGGRVISVVVSHRPRARGRSKYGTFDRLAVGICDLAGVMWLQRRARLACVEAVEADGDRQ